MLTRKKKAHFMLNPHPLETEKHAEHSLGKNAESPLGKWCLRVEWKHSVGAAGYFASSSVELPIPEDQHPSSTWVRPGLSGSATANQPKMTESGVESNSNLVRSRRVYS